LRFHQHDTPCQRLFPKGVAQAGESSMKGRHAPARLFRPNGFECLLCWNALTTESDGVCQQITRLG
jgi:hypothetical protein